MKKLFAIIGGVALVASLGVNVYQAEEIRQQNTSIKS